MLTFSLEPSNMLDVPSITFLSNYLQSYPSTLLVVSHDRAFLNEVATDIIHQHSERLDYYRGANFGMCSHMRTASAADCASRLILRNQRRTQEDC
jgi:ATPase subunit of ABC transporter with duplicated ATPase domains